MPSHATPSPTKLFSLAEGNESPDTSQQTTNARPSSIAVPSDATITKQAQQIDSPAFKTPTTTSRFRPGLEEMHPSKVHRSTTKHTGPAMQPPFRGSNTTTTESQSVPMFLAVAQNTPSKLPGAWPNMSSPKFDFSIGPDESVLSIEAQRIMESVRGEAAKIKAQMQAERDKQDLDNEEATLNSDFSGRKIAKPKGKSGRYSDAHRQEFQRMDSIAGHASIWKNKVQPNAALLTSKSHINLLADVVETQLPRSKSFKSLKVGRSIDGERIENLAPGKRAKKSYGDDTSSARPLSRDESAPNETLHTTVPKTSAHHGLPSAVTTPTKASLSRAASVKQSKPSLIPSPSRSNLTQMTGSPVMARSEGSKKYLSSLAKFSHIKSFLHRRQPGLNDPCKAPAGSPLAVPEEKLQLDKALPNFPQPARIRLLSSPAVANRVEFTPIAKPKPDFVPVSPSPSRIPGSKSLYKADKMIPDLVSYPSLANSPNITTRVKIPTASVPGDFTFRSDTTISFNPAITPAKTPTIRRVRPSGISTPVATFDPFPPIPHGLPNKKRRRADSDDEDIENTPPANATKHDADEPRTKKLKSSPQKHLPTQGPENVSGAMASRIPQSRGSKGKTKGRGVLSLSRLNMLARPKARN